MTDGTTTETATEPDLPIHVPLEGTFNVRDVGGWATADGHRVRTGLVHRADGLANLTDGDRAELVARGVRTVLDLRETQEGRHAPDALDGTDIEHLGMPVFLDRYYPMDPEDALAFRLPDRSLPTIYGLMIEEAGERFAEILTVLAEAEDPAVFHCSAGKDRTGMVAAFLLELLGVGRQTVLDDYAATERFLGADFVAALQTRFAAAGIVADLSKTATQAPRELMESTLAGIDDRFGSVEGYLLEHGLDDRVPGRLRDRLLG
ncbi:tyrosine-protein phosphatase [Brevibacterium litoralis]|uniref:tyrosine-protein phosphatase n=1 Tax=Brevibacterium litoralis TaxID=3138935 RepID=UPI0032EC5E14